jgi:hypothetical protein
MIKIIVLGALISTLSLIVQYETNLFDYYPPLELRSIDYPYAPD